MQGTLHAKQQKSKIEKKQDSQNASNKKAKGYNAMQ